MKKTTLHKFKTTLLCKTKRIQTYQNNRKRSAIDQLAQNFGSKAEMLEIFDDLINRIIQAYSGTEQELSFLAGDCDFLHQLKKALKEDI